MMLDMLLKASLNSRIFVFCCPHQVFDEVLNTFHQSSLEGREFVFIFIDLFTVYDDDDDDNSARFATSTGRHQRTLPAVFVISLMQFQANRKQVFSEEMRNSSKVRKYFKSISSALIASFMEDVAS